MLVEIHTLHDDNDTAIFNVLLSFSQGIVIDLSDIGHRGFLFPRRDIPIQPVLKEGKRERDVYPSMYHQMRPLYRYQNVAHLRRFLTEDFLPSL